jgi:cellulose synthase/poly-beta-1,6-N-acetylglucosamine synthase-like glycosyltransferase
LSRTDRINTFIGLGTWGLITFPIWGAIFFPLAVAWVVLAFNGYWLMRSAQLGLGAVVSYLKLRASERTDWLARASSQPGFDALHHLVIIPTYKEGDEVLGETLDHLLAQDFPRERVSVVLAFEQRDPGAPARAGRLLAKYRPRFGNVWALFHVQQPGDMPGKSSNLAWAAPRARTLLRRRGIDTRNVLLTICDADSRLHAKYLSNVAHAHLTDPGRDARLYQPALLFHANLDRLLPPLRATNSAYSAWSLARLVFGQRLVLQSTYSLPLELAHAVGYWDPDVIPEDSRICFKVLQHSGARAQVTPIFLPVRADAAEGATPWETVVAHYQQIRRWAWGASDVPYVLGGLVRRDAPRPKILPVLGFIEDHLTWPTHWFLITIGNKALPFLAPTVAATPECALLLEAASFLLSACLPFIFLAAGVDLMLRGGSRDPIEWMGELFGWALMPAITLLLTALPALDAHTRLLFGRRLGYQVTPKFAR